MEHHSRTWIRSRVEFDFFFHTFSEGLSFWIFLVWFVNYCIKQNLTNTYELSLTTVHSWIVTAIFLDIEKNTIFSSERMTKCHNFSSCQMPTRLDWVFYLSSDNNDGFSYWKKLLSLCIYVCVEIGANLMMIGKFIRRSTHLKENVNLWASRCIPVETSWFALLPLVASQHYIPLCVDKNGSFLCLVVTVKVETDISFDVQIVWVVWSGR